MKDKKFFNKGRNKNRRNSNEPSPVARIDDSIIREVSLLLELGATDELIRKQYGLCYSQIDFIKNNKKPLQTLEQKLLEEKIRKRGGNKQC